MTEIAVAQCKGLIQEFLDVNELPYTEVTGRQESSEGQPGEIIVRINGWKPNGIFKVIHQIAESEGFRVETDWGTA